MIKFITKYKDKESYGFTSPKIEFSALDDLLAWRKGRSYSCLDTETNFTLDYRSGELLLRQFGDAETQFVVDSTIDIPSEFYDDITWVAHNADFDYNQLKRHKIILKRVYDTMIAEKVLTQGKYTEDFIKSMYPFRLDSMVYNLTGYAMDKAIRATYVDLNFTQDQIIYAAEDIEYLDPVYHDTWKRIQKDNLEDCLNLENRYVLALADMRYHGIFLDRVAWAKLEVEAIKEASDMSYEIDDYLIQDYPKIVDKHGDAYQFDMFNADKKQRKLKLNYNSHLQVKKVFSLLGIDVKDKHGKETVGIVELRKIRVKSKFLEGYINLKVLEKKISSFGSSWFDYINAVTGRIHCSVNQIINTGRTATYSPNLYQTPREDKYRNCYKSEGDNMFLGGDYSAQEGRIMAEKADDDNYIDFFNTGDGDAHSFVASKMFSAKYGRELIVKSKSLSVKLFEGDDSKKIAEYFIKEGDNKPDTPWIEGEGYVVIDLSKKNEWRQKGKTLNFFLSFGGSAFTLANDLKIPMEEAQGLVNAFFTAFPKLKAMFDKESLLAITHGYTIANTITKRRRYYPDWEDMKNTYSWILQQKELLGKTNYWEQMKNKTSLISKENKKAYMMKGDMEKREHELPHSRNSSRYD